MNDKEKFLFDDFSKYPVLLFLDSYDESKLKSNLITKYENILGNKLGDKIIITCRTDYLKGGDEKLF